LFDLEAATDASGLLRNALQVELTRVDQLTAAAGHHEPVPIRACVSFTLAVHRGRAFPDSEIGYGFISNGGGSRKADCSRLWLARSLPVTSA
jgi:hypothetical protein